MPTAPQRIARIIRQGSEAFRLFSNWHELLSARCKRDDGETVLRTRSGLRIAIRHNRWDAEIIREQFLDRDYLVGFRAPDGRPPVIVDIGSYIGDFALYCAHYLEARVIAYEPTIENFTMLEKNIGLNPELSSRVTAINRGVASTPEVDANVKAIGREIHASSSWYANDAAAEKRTFHCDTIEEVLGKHSLHRVDLLKIDCEGGEYDIVAAAAPEIFTKINSIVYEWHRTPLWEEKLSALEQKLHAVGYTVLRVGQLGYASRS